MQTFFRRNSIYVLICFVTNQVRYNVSVYLRGNQLGLHEPALKFWPTYTAETTLVYVTLLNSNKWYIELIYLTQVNVPGNCSIRKISFKPVAVQVACTRMMGLV